ncbi:MAG: Methionine aminopeptidase 1 [Alectoria sarmentosa]|nr:MAG: Methionine aminopeptidase 1 [Alectoria sarmentosa]
MSETWKRELVLFARLLQKELGRLPCALSEHKSVHKSGSTALHNPFPTFPFTGSLRPIYPLSDRRPIPDSIPHPNYAKTEGGNPNYKFAARNSIICLDKKQQAGMRKVCRMAREVLDAAARELKPGVTTDYIDEVVHRECIKRNRMIREGDIINLDVTLYYGGFHGDLNETYYIGEKAMKDRDSVRVVETARECLEEAIKLVKPGMAFKDPGTVIEKHAKSKNCGVIRTYCGHGINSLFHCAPNIPHYAKNKAVGIAKPGMTFTIEPMISLGSFRDKTWPDDWTSVTQDGSRTAQFEHTLLVTEHGVEVLTARLADSPGGPVEMPPEVKADEELSAKGASGK